MKLASKIKELKNRDYRGILSGDYSDAMDLLSRKEESIVLTNRTANEYTHAFLPSAKYFV